MAKTVSVKYQMTANTVKVTIRDENGKTYVNTSKRTGPGSFRGVDGETPFDDNEDIPESILELASSLQWMDVCSYLKWEA